MSATERLTVSRDFDVEYPEAELEKKNLTGHLTGNTWHKFWHEDDANRVMLVREDVLEDPLEWL